MAEEVGEVPGIAPFPTVAGQVVEAIAAAKGLLDGAVATEAVQQAILMLERALPQVRLVGVTRGELSRRCTPHASWLVAIGMGARSPVGCQDLRLRIAVH